jgi:hypothetical protein
MAWNARDSYDAAVKEISDEPGPHSVACLMPEPVAAIHATTRGSGGMPAWESLLPQVIFWLCPGKVKRLGVS